MQNSCSGANPVIVMSPNLPLFRVEVAPRPTRFDPGDFHLRLPSFLSSIIDFPGLSLRFDSVSEVGLDKMPFVVYVLTICKIGCHKN